MTTTYIIIAAIVVVIGLAAGLITYRARRELPPAEQKPSLPGRDEQAGTGPSTATETAEPQVEPVADDVTATATDLPAADAGLDELVEPEAPERELEKPEKLGARWSRLRGRLAGSRNPLSRGLLTLLSRDRLDEEAWEDLEDTLITADVGVEQSTKIVEALRTRVRVEGIASPEAARSAMREELIKALGDSDRRVHTERAEGKPAVVLVVGVNGTGKTTTCGKLGRALVADDKDVVLGAADTFRAAAADQLQTWGDRVGVPVVRGAEGGDPASVAFDAVKAGIEGESDTVIVDTAGRLHTKTGLMDELGKIKRVIEKQAPVGEVLLVLDATTGQNGLVQARVFRDVVDITGVMLSKLDSSAKGGIVFAVQAELGVPVKLVGLGEGADDMAPFEPAEFVDALLS